MHQPNVPVRRIRIATLVGLGVGAFIEVPAVLAAIVSGGAGHGSYIAARALFPFSMLLTLVEGSIGPIAIGVGLLQFPLYGALISRISAANTTISLFWLAAAHAAAAIACFSGLLRDFS